MDPDNFSEKIKYGKSVLKRIEKSCSEQKLDLEQILYDYFHLFKNAENKEEIKNILADIADYNPRNNLTITDEYEAHVSRIKKEITPMEIEEGEITCYKCGGKKVLRSQAQTRSGDEAMAQYYRCVNSEKPSCRNKWKVG